MSRSDRFFQWYWERVRGHPIAGIVALCVATLIVTVAIPVVVGSALYFGLSVRDSVLFFFTVAGVILIGVAGVVPLERRIRNFAGWERRADVDPLGVWADALQLSWSATARGFAVLAVGHVCVSVPMVRHLRGLDTTETAASVVAAIMLTGVGALVLLQGVHLAVTPSIRALLEIIPDQLPELPRIPTVKRRFQAAAIGAGFITGVTSGAVTTFVEPAIRFQAAVATSLLMAVYAAVLLNFALLEPSLAPLRALGQATNRVRRGDFGQALPVTTADELGDLLRGFNLMQRGLAEREALHAAFGSYVDPSLAQRLLEQGSSVFDGVEVDVTVLFADVRGFTTIAEGTSPADAVALLNEIFDVAVPIIESHDGHTNHYLGDGLLAVFGAPNHLDRHADAAIAAAVEMQRAFRTKFGADLRVGIGVNTGQVIAGTIGGGGRYEFTVIGDAVNVAARVEQLTRETGDAILLTRATFDALASPRPATRRRGVHPIRGKSAAVELRALNP